MFLYRFLFPQKIYNIVTRTDVVKILRPQADVKSHIQKILAGKLSLVELYLDNGKKLWAFSPL